MPSTALHDLHQALDKLCTAYHENEITETEVTEVATELTIEWIRIEVARKATIGAKWICPDCALIETGQRCNTCGTLKWY